MAAGASGIVYKTSGGSATLFKAPQDSCPGSILHRLSLLWSRLLSFLSSPLAFFILKREREKVFSLMLLTLSQFSPSFPIVYRRQPDARQQGRLYVLPRLSVARLPRRFPIYFRILPLATRRDVTRPGCALSQCNTNQIEAPISCHELTL